MRAFPHALLSLLAVSLLATPMSVLAAAGTVRALDGNEEYHDSAGPDHFDEGGEEGADVEHRGGPFHHHHPGHSNPHYHDHPEVPPIESYNKAAGCDCSTEDAEDLLDAQAKVLISLGYTYALNSGTDKKLGFRTLQRAITKCIKFGVEILGMLHCGGCVDNLSSVPDVKTYDCCCDSDSIKDIIKDQLTGIVAAAPLLLQPGGQFLFNHLVDGIKQAAKRAIRGIVKDVYNIKIEEVEATIAEEESDAADDFDDFDETDHADP